MSDAITTKSAAAGGMVAPKASQDHGNKIPPMIRILASIGLLMVAVAAHAQYSIDFYTIDAGGGTSTGGVYRITGTVGQPDAGVSSGGPYVLQGGFWPGLTVPGIEETPTLFIELIQGQVTISWSPDAAGFVLEQADNVAGSSWMEGPPGNPAGPIAPAEVTRFYRLRKP
jgi:hypothetical protein